MFKVHTIDSFRDVQLYMHDTQDMIYFVDTSCIHQTILLRLPPVFVCASDESSVEYIVPQVVLDTFRHMERHARSFFGQDTDPQKSPPCARTLHTTWFRSSSSTMDVGQFVEAIVAIVGIEKNPQKGWSFVYRTVQVRAVDVTPPTLDETLLESIDLFST